MAGNDIDLGAMLFAVIFAGVVFYGMYQRRMPLRWFDLDRATNPLGFWIAAIAFAAASAFFALMAFDPGFR